MEPEALPALRAAPQVLVPPQPAKPSPPPGYVARPPRGKIGGGLHVNPPPPPACSGAGPWREPFMGFKEKAGVKAVAGSAALHLVHMEAIFKKCAIKADKARIALSVSQFEDLALTWWLGLTAAKPTPYTNWTSYKSALLRTFGPPPK